MRYLAKLIQRNRALTPIVLVVLVGGVFTATIDTPNPSVPSTVTVTLGGPGHDTLTLPPVAQQQLAEQVGESGMHAEPPAAHAPAVVKHQEQLAPDGQTVIPKHLPLAAAEVPGCVTKLVRNFSSRPGTPVLLGIIHYTASPPTLGWAGVLANVNWFDQPAAQASSNEIMSRDGHCALAVGEASKAWTQAGFNPWSVSVEIVTDGTPPTFMTPDGDQALARLLVGWHQRWNLPLQRAIISGCNVIRPGITDHNSLGTCGGGHHDITPYNVDQAIANARALLTTAQSPLTTIEQRIDQRISHPHLSGHTRRYWCQRNRARRATIRTNARTPHHGGWDAHDRSRRYQTLAHAYTLCKT